MTRRISPPFPVHLLPPMTQPGKPGEARRDLAVNRRAGHEYFLLDRFETGIELFGTEVKSLREGGAQLRDAYGLVRNGEIFLLNCHIAPWPHSLDNHAPERTRRLLLRKAEIRKIEGRLKTRGLTIVPTRIYTSGRRIKCEIALAKGKKDWDKRETERRRTVERETRQAIRERSGR